MTGSILFWVLVGALAVAAVVVGLNRTRRPDYAAVEHRPAETDVQVAGTDLTVLTWNIGYGGLGQGADFVIDGGRSVRALSRDQIAGAGDAIATRLDGAGADVLCLQEVAGPSFLTRGVDVRAIIDHALRRYHGWFWGDFVTRLVPKPLQFRHGMASYAACDAQPAEVLVIPGADTLFLGCLKKCYVGLITRIPIGGTDQQWCVINIHLPVFNVADGERSEFVRCVLDTAEAAYAAGHLVVIGGDWNMRMTEGPHDIAPPDWLVDYPTDALQNGWQIVDAAGGPTVRSLKTAFKLGETFTTSIDGFVVSPNVEVVSARVLDDQFEHADHNPVLAQFRRG